LFSLESEAFRDKEGGKFTEKINSQLKYIFPQEDLFAKTLIVDKPTNVTIPGRLFKLLDNE
jgi:hypothetical protein